MSVSVAIGMEAQKMIDYRLDTLDRLLISSGMSRAERMDVVQSVEDQIHEMVDRRSHGEPSREDIMRVLGELDPPEAYVSDWSSLGAHEPNAHPPMANQFDALGAQPASAASKHSALAITSFVLSLLSLLLLILFPLGFVLSLAGFVCSLICLLRSRRNDNRLWMPVVAQCVFALQAMFALAIAVFS